MRHSNAGRKFDRNTSSRRAMFRNLAANLVLHERIETTDAKAKELRRVAERLITKAVRLGTVAYTTQDQLSESDNAPISIIEFVDGPVSNKAAADAAETAPAAP